MEQEERINEINAEIEDLNETIDSEAEDLEAEFDNGDLDLHELRADTLDCLVALQNGYANYDRERLQDLADDFNNVAELILELIQNVDGYIDDIKMCKEEKQELMEEE